MTDVELDRQASLSDLCGACGGPINTDDGHCACSRRLNGAEATREDLVMEIEHLRGLLKASNEECSALSTALDESQTALDEARSFAESYAGTPTPWKSGR